MFLGSEEGSSETRSQIRSREYANYGEDNTNFVGKFLNKIQKEKQIVGDIIQRGGFKKDAPKRDYAELVRDFRIRPDEED